MHRARLEIAGIAIEVSSAGGDTVAWINEHWPEFRTRRTPDYRIRIRCVQRDCVTKTIPVALNNRTLVFRRSGYRAMIDWKQRRVDVSVVDAIGMADLVRSVLSSVLIREGGLLLHAAAVVDEGNGYVFCGHSETGKTTIARLAKPRLVLTDETAAIRRVKEKWQVCSTPFAGDFRGRKHNAGAVLKALFFPRKNTQCMRRPLSSARNAEGLLSCAFLDVGNAPLTRRLIQNCVLLGSCCPGYELFFNPTKALWRHVYG